jgi:hypothetical protein
MKGQNEIIIEFDDFSGSYYASVVPPVAIGSGNTALKALQDLRRTAYHGIDTLINIKVVNIESQNIKKQEV